jgi:hypothetical protein
MADMGLTDLDVLLYRRAFDPSYSAEGGMTDNEFNSLLVATMRDIPGKIETGFTSIKPIDYNDVLSSIETHMASLAAYAAEGSDIQDR